MIVLRDKLFSVQYDMLFCLGNLKYCENYPKFVQDYIKNVQSQLKGGNALCIWNFPVVCMPCEEDDSTCDGKYFESCIKEIGSKLRLVWKDGKWFEEKGILFKSYTPIKDPADWLYNYIIQETGEDDPKKQNENSKNTDYDKFRKALDKLRKMIGRY